MNRGTGPEPAVRTAVMHTFPPLVIVLKIACPFSLLRFSDTSKLPPPHASLVPASRAAVRIAQARVKSYAFRGVSFAPAGKRKTRFPRLSGETRVPEMVGQRGIELPSPFTDFDMLSIGGQNIQSSKLPTLFAASLYIAFTM